MTQELEPHEEWLELLEEALDCGAISRDPAHGIAKQVVAQGVNSLSPKQKQIFDSEIWPALRPLQIARDRSRNLDRVHSD